MKKHVENTLELTDVYKKIDNWAKDNDFNETKSTATKESFNFTFTKNYGKFLKFRGGLFLVLLLVSALVTARYQIEDKVPQKKTTIIAQQKNHSKNQEQRNYSGNRGAFQEGFERGWSETWEKVEKIDRQLRKVSKELDKVDPLLDEIERLATHKTRDFSSQLSILLLAILFPGVYVAYYNYKKHISMKFCVNINTIRKGGKTDIQISSKSDFQELKNDIVKLYNAFF